MSLKDKLKFTGKVKKAVLAVYASSLVAICAGLSLNIPAMINQKEATKIANDAGFGAYYQTYEDKDNFLGIPNMDKKLKAQEEFMQTIEDESAKEKYNDFTKQRKTLSKASTATAVVSLATAALTTAIAAQIEKKKNKEKER